MYHSNEIDVLSNHVRYHTGSVAFGSFLIALVTLIRMLLEYVDQKLKEQKQSDMAKFVLKCVKLVEYIFQDAGKFYRIFQDAGKFYRIFQDAGKFNKIFQDAGKFYKIFQDAVNFYKIFRAGP